VFWKGDMCRARKTEGCTEEKSLFYAETHCDYCGTKCSCTKFPLKLLLSLHRNDVGCLGGWRYRFVLGGVGERSDSGTLTTSQTRRRLCEFCKTIKANRSFKHIEKKKEKDKQSAMKAGRKLRKHEMFTVERFHRLAFSSNIFTLRIFIRILIIAV